MWWMSVNCSERSDAYVIAPSGISRTSYRENAIRCVLLSTTAMFMGMPISRALASHAAVAARAASSVRLREDLVAGISGSVGSVQE